jgi:hypothetical protein
LQRRNEGLALQIVCDVSELLESSLEVFNDLLRDHAGAGEVGAFFEGFVLEPEDVEVDFVALD